MRDAACPLSTRGGGSPRGRPGQVLLRLPYTAAIDVWSLGCIGSELLLGLPLLPGTCEYSQMGKVLPRAAPHPRRGGLCVCVRRSLRRARARQLVEAFGMPPRNMLERGKWTHKYFKVEDGEYMMKTPQEFEEENRVQLPKERRYFKCAPAV